MSDSRIASAMTRIETALQRIAHARANIEEKAKAGAKADDTSGSAKVMALVNSHEKLREEVADTMRDLDALIEDLES